MFKFASLSYFTILFCFMLSLLTSSFALPLEKRASGKGTWFDVGLGACGKTNKNSDLIVALATGDYAGGKHCNKFITIKSGGKTARAQVRDMCPGCRKGDLDMSPSLFQRFAGLGKGVIQVTWNFS